MLDTKHAQCACKRSKQSYILTLNSNDFFNKYDISSPHFDLG